MRRINPRFKVGDIITYSPVRGIKSYPQWTVSKVFPQTQRYHLWRDGQPQKKRHLDFNRQRQYRVFGIPFEQQPEMWP
jgi:hypothetical protein